MKVKVVEYILTLVLPLMKRCVIGPIKIISMKQCKTTLDISMIKSLGVSV